MRGVQCGESGGVRCEGVDRRAGTPDINAPLPDALSPKNVRPFDDHFCAVKHERGAGHDAEGNVPRDIEARDVPRLGAALRVLLPADAVRVYRGSVRVCAWGGGRGAGA